MGYHDLLHDQLNRPALMSFRFFRNTLVLLFLAGALWSCRSQPLYMGTLAGSGKPALQKDAPAALFTVMMLKVAYSNSNGLNWIARLNDDDYREFYRGVLGIMENDLTMRPVDRTAILNQPLYLEGRFPLREKWYLNTAQLPMVTSASEEELMLRMARGLGVEYFITVLTDHEVRKVMALPAVVDSTLYFNIYSGRSGLIYQAQTNVETTAEPYGGSIDLGEVYRNYLPVLNETAAKNQSLLLEQLREKLQSEVRIYEPQPDAPVETEKADDLGF